MTKDEATQLVSDAAAHIDAWLPQIERLLPDEGERKVWRAALTRQRDRLHQAASVLSGEQEKRTGT